MEAAVESGISIAPPHIEGRVNINKGRFLLFEPANEMRIAYTKQLSDKPVDVVGKITDVLDRLRNSQYKGLVISENMQSDSTDQELNVWSLLDRVRQYNQRNDPNFLVYIITSDHQAFTDSLKKRIPRESDRPRNLFLIDKTEIEQGGIESILIPESVAA